jgi:Na+/proline symporter
LPAWITGLAFIAANLGALEILGQAANGAHYGVAAVHYYWLGAVPAMVFLGIVMMPFYYAAKVRSVPEYLRLRFNEATHAFNAATFAIANVHADLRRADALLGAEQAGHARAAGDARPGFGADPAGPGDVG